MPDLIGAVLLITILASNGIPQTKVVDGQPPNAALVNGTWFNGRSFEPRTIYSVDGRFTLKKPVRVDRVLDLAGTWIIPPFAEAHNHNIGTGVEERDTRAIEMYLADGVFYVKIQGNLPLTDERKRLLSLNRPDGIDAVFAQGSLTATGGQPITLVESCWRCGGITLGIPKRR